MNGDTATGVLPVVHSVPTAASIGAAVETAYAVGRVVDCHLIRRGFNDVYGVVLEDGRRLVARLSAVRLRGPHNNAYELALLAHLHAQGGLVAAPRRPVAGGDCITLRAAEGPRALAVFEHLSGDPPGEVTADIERTGAGLAHLHQGAQGYAGPPSLYTLDLAHLLDRPLQWLLSARTVDAALHADFTALAGELGARIRAMPLLSQAHVHGDCHGGNNFMDDGPDGRRRAVFFDFDDAGPGYLAYDLAVFLWNRLLRLSSATLDNDGTEKWQAFLRGYRSVRALPEPDFDAIAAFVSVRHFWFMGEFAGRAPAWGTQALPATWLRRQVELLRAWGPLTTPT